MYREWLMDIDMVTAQQMESGFVKKGLLAF